MRFILIVFGEAVLRTTQTAVGDRGLNSTNHFDQGRIKNY